MEGLRIDPSSGLPGAGQGKGNTMNTKNRISFSVIAAVSMGVLSSAAVAAPSFTTVQAPPSGEKNHRQILSQIYGGTWSTASNGRDYTNNQGISAMRLADKGLATPTSLTTGVSGTDNAWTGPALMQIVAQAKFAADNSVFGYFDDTGTDRSFRPIFNTSSLGTSATIDMPSAFRWALKDLTTGKTWTSRSGDNNGVGKYCNYTYDQLVTYKITNPCDPSGCVQWALFWEDRIKGQSSDYDFNDAVITICVVPSPGAASLVCLGGVTLLGRRKRKA